MCLRRWFSARSGLVLAAAVIPVATHASAMEAPMRGSAALVIEGWAVTPRMVDALQRLVALRDPQMHDAPTARAEVVAAIVRDRVLGEQAAREPGDAVLFDASRVAFSPQASAQASLMALLEQVFREPLQAAWPNDGAAHFIVRRHPLAPKQLSTLLGAGPTLRLDDTLSASQLGQLGKVPLLDYRFSGGPLQHVTVADVWQRLEVHGRTALAGGDVGFVQQQAERLVHEAFVRRWVEHSGRLNAAELLALQQLMLDHQRFLAWAEQQGANADAQEPSEVVLQLQRDVSRDDIARYYAEHPAEFQRIERVRARHIRCGDEACANAAADALARGEPFADVARRYTVDTATRDQGGDLGWIDAAQTSGHWLAQFAFAQVPGTASRPVRAPSSADAPAGWEIVQVDERVTGLHAADSETVRFIASQAVARHMAAARFAQLRERLLAAARVEVDPAKLGVSLATLREKGL